MIVNKKLGIDGHTYAPEVNLRKKLNELMIYHFGMPKSWEFQKSKNQNLTVPSWRISSQSSHQKSPKSPNGGISPNH